MNLNIYMYKYDILHVMRISKKFVIINANLKVLNITLNKNF